MRHVDVFVVRLLDELREVPQFQAAIEGCRQEEVSAAAEGERVDRLRVAAELGDEVAVREIPDEDASVGAGGREETAVDAEGEFVNRALREDNVNFLTVIIFSGYLVAGHDAYVVPGHDVPQTDRSVARPGRDVVRVRVELYALRK